MPEMSTMSEIDLGGVSSLGLRCPRAAAGITSFFWLHGGGFTMGSSRSHKGLACSGGGTAPRSQPSFPTHRLAPENRHPAALEDCVRSYQAILGEGVQANRIILAGDSAGGGTCCCNRAQAQGARASMPAGMMLLRPGSIYANRGWSHMTKSERDPFLTTNGLNTRAVQYLGEGKLPLLKADMRGLPPAFIQTGEAEILMSDSTTLAERLGRRGAGDARDLAGHVPRFPGALSDAEPGAERDPAAWSVRPPRTWRSEDAPPREGEERAFSIQAIPAKQLGSWRTVAGLCSARRRPCGEGACAGCDDQGCKTDPVAKAFLQHLVQHVLSHHAHAAAAAERIAGVGIAERRTGVGLSAALLPSLSLHLLLPRPHRAKDKRCANEAGDHDIAPGRLALAGKGEAEADDNHAEGGDGEEVHAKITILLEGRCVVRTGVRRQAHARRHLFSSIGILRHLALDELDARGGCDSRPLLHETATHGSTKANSAITLAMRTTFITFM